MPPMANPRQSLFQSTLPVRGATGDAEFFGPGDGISIHAPREGSDAERLGLTITEVYFNPRSP